MKGEDRSVCRNTNSYEIHEMLYHTNTRNHIFADADACAARSRSCTHSLSPCHQRRPRFVITQDDVGVTVDIRVPACAWLPEVLQTQPTARGERLFLATTGWIPRAIVETALYPRHQYVVFSPDCRVRLFFAVGPIPLPLG
jgi:hypothetical protein